MFGGPVLPLVDDDAARALHLGDRSEVLFHAEADDGARLVTRRPWLRDAGTTMRAFEARAADLAGEHTHERWRFAQLVVGSGGAFTGLRIVIDWRDDTALVSEVVAPTAARARRELDILDEHFGPHRRFPPLRTAGRALLAVAAGAAVWLSAMRELQATPASHGVAIAMYLAVLTGIGLLLLHAILRGLPRGGVVRRLQPAHLRATLGWAWLAAATVFLLRPPREPYMEWPPGYWAALGVTLAFGLASLAPRTRARREPSSPAPRWQELPSGAFPVVVRREPERVVAEGEAVAAYWRTRGGIGLEEPQWNLEEHAWPSDVGEVAVQAYDTWDGAPVRVVEARAHDRTVVVRSHDARTALALARQLTDAWFGARAAAHGPEPARRSTWTVAVVVGWLAALTFAVGSDLGPSTYVWHWPTDFEVDHDYPVLAAATGLGVLVAWGWAVRELAVLLTSDLPRRDWRRSARHLAWQVAVTWVGVQVLTVTLLPRLEDLHPTALTSGWVLAVVNGVVLVLALAVVLVIRPESPLGTPTRGGE